MKVLIVDDNQEFCEIVEAFLQPYAECDIAVNGNQGIESFRSSIEQGKLYDLVCLDIKMPEMDGHQVLEAIRKIEKDKGYAEIDNVKVIMVSALGDYKNIMDAYSEHCDAYVQKPVGRRDFLGEVARLGLIKLEKEDTS